ncbi:MAG: S-adenosylhomocysteine deaminase, partial [Proteobacteria bacterium]|nr:S-adenosylhomocysteine deaminase [Pseudomonadota bacterium]
MTALPKRCEILVTADTVLTGEAAQPQVDGAAIAITNERIVWLGPARDLPPNFAAAKRLDLQGHVVIPGLVNVHTH